jgi:hypothetical protein
VLIECMRVELWGLPKIYILAMEACWTKKVTKKCVQPQNSGFSMLHAHYRDHASCFIQQVKAKYTKNANVGDMVHSNHVHVSTEAQCKCWYGRWDTGVLQKQKSQSTVQTNASTRSGTLSQMDPRSWCLSVTSIVVLGCGLP